jgi:hypothetical protein
MDSIDLSLLAAYPGEYRQALIRKLYNALNLQAEGILVIPNLKSDLLLHKLVVGKGLKPYTGQFKSKAGDVSFVPRTLSVKKAQRDLSVEPSKYIGTFMQGQRGAGENANNMTIPFAQYMWESVLEETATELNLETVYHGVGTAGFATYAALTAYSVGALIKYTQDSEVRYFRCITATSAGQNPDTHPAKWEWAGGRAVVKGYGKIIADEITAGNLTAVSTGAITSTDAYDQFTDVYRSHLETVRMGKHGKVITLCGMNAHDALNDDYENKISKNFETVDGVTYLAKTNRNNIIMPVSWLSGSGRLISTVANNLVAGTDQLNDMNVIKVIENMYNLDAGLSFMLGFEIQDLDALRVNDQA